MTQVPLTRWLGSAGSGRSATPSAREVTAPRGRARARATTCVAAPSATLARTASAHRRRVVLRRVADPARGEDRQQTGAWRRRAALVLGDARPARTAPPVPTCQIRARRCRRPRCSGRSSRRGRRSRSSTLRRTAKQAPETHSTGCGMLVCGRIADHLVDPRRLRERRGGGRAPARSSSAGAGNGAASSRASRRAPRSAARPRRRARRARAPRRASPAHRAGSWRPG